MTVDRRSFVQMTGGGLVGSLGVLTGQQALSTTVDNPTEVQTALLEAHADTDPLEAAFTHLEAAEDRLIVGWNATLSNFQPGERIHNRLHLYTGYNPRTNNQKDYGGKLLIGALVTNDTPTGELEWQGDQTSAMLPREYGFAWDEDERLTLEVVESISKHPTGWEVTVYYIDR